MDGDIPPHHYHRHILHVSSTHPGQTNCTCKKLQLQIMALVALVQCGGSGVKRRRRRRLGVMAVWPLALWLEAGVRRGTCGEYCSHHHLITLYTSTLRRREQLRSSWWYLPLENVTTGTRFATCMGVKTRAGLSLHLNNGELTAGHWGKRQEASEVNISTEEL